MCIVEKQTLSFLYVNGINIIVLLFSITLSLFIKNL